MADEIRDAGATWMRPYVVDGLPASGANEPDKAEGAALFGVIQDKVDEARSIGTGGYVGYTSKSAMDGDLAHDAGTLAKVGGDATEANNGTYLKSGASGEGSWAAFEDPLEAVAEGVTTDAAAAAAAKDDAETAVTDAQAIVDTFYDGLPTTPPFDFITNFFPCDEGAGHILKDAVGGETIDIALADYFDGDGSYRWENGDLILNDYWFWTSGRFSGGSAIVIFEMAPGLSAYPLTITSNTGWTTGLTRSATNIRQRKLSGMGITQPIGRWRDGGSCISWDTGAPEVAYFERTADFTNQALFVNAARADGAGKAAGDYKVLGIILMTGTRTIDELTLLKSWIAAECAKRGRYTYAASCPNRCKALLWDGESTNHTTLIIDGTLDDATRRQRFNTYLMTTVSGAASNTETPKLRRLTYDTGGVYSGYRLGNEDASIADRGRKLGPLFGWAERDLYREDLHNLPTFHIKIARGSTYSAPAGTALASGGVLATSVSRYGPIGTGASDEPTLSHILALRGYILAEASLRKQGYGILHIARSNADGINDTGVASGVLAEGVFQGWQQDIHDYEKRLMGLADLPLVPLVSHLPIPGAAESYAAQLSSVADSSPYLQGYTNDGAGELKFDNLLLIRADFDALDAAEGDVVTLLQGDDYGLNVAGNDPTHPSLEGMRAYGGDLRDLALFSAPLVEAYDDVTIQP